MFKYARRRGILVQREVKASPTKGRVVTASSDRIGTLGVDAVSTQWVETKTLAFIEDVLKANWGSHDPGRDRAREHLAARLYSGGCLHAGGASRAVAREPRAELEAPTLAV